MEKRVTMRLAHGIIMCGVVVGMSLMLAACGEQPAPTASEWQDPQGEPVQPAQPEGQEQETAAPEQEEVNWPAPAAE